MASAPHLRIATPQDQDVVVSLLEALVRELGPEEMVDRVCPRLPRDIEIALAASNVRIFLASQQSEIIGLSRGDIIATDPIFRLRADPRCGYIDQMYVAPAHRGAGIGTLLLQECERWFKDEGIVHSLLHAAPQALPFYERYDYRTNREMFKRL